MVFVASMLDLLCIRTKKTIKLYHSKQWVLKTRFFIEHWPQNHLSLQPNNGSSSSSSPRAPTKKSFFIGVAGGTASGKTTVCNLIISQLRDQRVVLVNQDEFYDSLNEEKLKKVHEYNFDHPEAFDTKLLLSFWRS